LYVRARGECRFTPALEVHGAIPHVVARFLGAPRPRSMNVGDIYDWKSAFFAHAKGSHMYVYTMKTRPLATPPLSRFAVSPSMSLPHGSGEISPCAMSAGKPYAYALYVYSTRIYLQPPRVP
jgi:hypothetical protein